MDVRGARRRILQRGSRLALGVAASVVACASGCEGVTVTAFDATVDATVDVSRPLVRDDARAMEADASDGDIGNAVDAADAGRQLDAADDAREEPQAVELGTGRFAFEALPRAGGRSELVMGPQGGWHIYGRVRLRGIAPDVYLTFSLIPEAGGAPVNLANETVRRQERRGLVASGDAFESSAGELVILADGVRPPDVVGRRFRFGVRVERPDPSVVRVLVGSDERLVTVVDEAP